MGPPQTPPGSPQPPLTSAMTLSGPGPGGVYRIFPTKRGLIPLQKICERGLDSRLRSSSRQKGPGGAELSPHHQPHTTSPHCPPQPPAEPPTAPHSLVLPEATGLCSELFLSRKALTSLSSYQLREGILSPPPSGCPQAMRDRAVKAPVLVLGALSPTSS